MNLYSENEKISNKTEAKVLEAYMCALRARKEAITGEILTGMCANPVQYKECDGYKKAISITYNTIVGDLAKTIRELESEV